MQTLEIAHTTSILYLRMLNYGWSFENKPICTLTNTWQYSALLFFVLTSHNAKRIFPQKLFTTLTVRGCIFHCNGYVHVYIHVEITQTYKLLVNHRVWYLDHGSIQNDWKQRDVQKYDAIALMAFGRRREYQTIFTLLNIQHVYLKAIWDSQ